MKTLIAICALGLARVAPAAEVFIDNLAIGQAISIGRDSEARRERFHSSYFARLGSPDIDSVEIITEFRRVVLATEERARLGDRFFGVPQALEVLSRHRGTITLIVRIRYSPLAVPQPAIPPYEVVIYVRGAPARTPISLLLQPRFAAGGGEVPYAAAAAPGAPGRGQPGQPPGAAAPMLGARVDATFLAQGLDLRATHLVGVRLEDKELQRIPVDFGSVR